jgi:hypothetical protein
MRSLLHVTLDGRRNLLLLFELGTVPVFFCEIRVDAKRRRSAALKEPLL